MVGYPCFIEIIVIFGGLIGSLQSQSISLGLRIIPKENIRDLPMVVF